MFLCLSVYPLSLTVFLSVPSLNVAILKNVEYRARMYQDTGYIFFTSRFAIDRTNSEWRKVKNGMCYIYLFIYLFNTNRLNV